jgi:hypothetical protein
LLQLNDPTRAQLGDYYGRLLSWMTNGWLIDELGRNISGGHTWNIPFWEVFNEPEGCHGLDAAEYTKQFDVIVEAMRKQASPEVSCRATERHRVVFSCLFLSSFVTHFVVSP